MIKHSSRIGLVTALLVMLAAACSGLKGTGQAPAGDATLGAERASAVAPTSGASEQGYPALGEASAAVPTDRASTIATARMQVSPSSATIVIALDPDATTLVNCQRVILSVPSQEQAPVGYVWWVDSDEFEQPGELSQRTGPSVVFVGPAKGAGNVTVHVRDDSAGVHARGSVTFAIDDRDPLAERGGVTRITRTCADEYSPSIAPRGDVILTSVHENAGSYLELLAPDGRRLRRLTETGRHFHPAFAPDGDAVVFASERDDNIDVYTIGTDGTGLRRLTRDKAADQYPAYAANGRRIVFESNRSGNWDLFVMDANGGNQRPIRTTAANERFPSLSPDGAWVVYQSDEFGDWDIFVASADGRTEPRQLTFGRARDAQPSFAPDGLSLVYETNQDGDYEIYRVTIDGRILGNLTNSPESDDQVPSFSPDGRTVLFQSEHGGPYDIYQLRIAGGE